MLERLRPTSSPILATLLLVLAGCASHGQPQSVPATAAGSAAKSQPVAVESARDHDASGASYRDRGLLDEAEREYRLALQQDPNDTVALAGLGEVAVARGQYAQAVPLLERATRVSSQMVPAFLALGDADVATGNWNGAAAAYRQAVALAPSNAGARLSLARVLTHLGDYDEAEGACRSAIRLSSDDPPTLARAYRQLGEVYSADGQPPEAMAALYKASELNPRDVETARSTGVCAARAGLYAEAAAAYARLLQLAPLDVDGKKQLAWVNFKLERYPLAIDDYEAVSDSLGVVDRYYLAQSYAKLEKADRAAALFREVAQADPATYKGVYCNMAYAYYDASRYQRAIEAAREGLASDSSSACLRFCWAQALDKLGRHEEAIPVFEAVLNDPAYSESAERELERQRRIVRLLQSGNQKGSN